MRWRPDGPSCVECGFDWQISRAEAIEVVGNAPEAVNASLAAIHDPLEQGPDRWSASMYIWHLVDVLRIGIERLLTLAIDPGFGVPCWDENALATDRRYHLLSPAVGMAVLDRTAQEWAEVAQATPSDAATNHPEVGRLVTVDLIRRNAHEVRHHLLDIERWVRR